MVEVKYHMKGVTMRSIFIALVLFICLPVHNSYATWARVYGYEAGSIDGKASPTTPVAYEYTVTVENTISALPFPSGGGCITMSYLDFLTPTPDSITTTLKNAIGLPITGPVATALTADGMLYQTDTGNPICIGRGFSFTFTGTVAVGDKFRLIYEAMTK